MFPILFLTEPTLSNILRQLNFLSRLEDPLTRVKKALHLVRRECKSLNASNHQN